MDESLPVPPLQFPVSSLPRKMQGYDRAATEDLFGKVAASYEAVWLQHQELEEKVTELEQQLDELQKEVDKYDDQKSLLGQALIDTRRSAAAIQEEAEQAAAAMKEQAREQADAVLKQAQAEAEKIVQEVEPKVQAKAAEILSNAEQERARLEGEIDRLREFSDETQHELSSFLVAALRWHKTSLPEGERVPEAEALEEVLEQSSASDSASTREQESLSNGADEPKRRRLAAPRLSPPSS